jgi:hypothetical protein
MNKTLAIVVSLTMSAVCAFNQMAQADSMDASCEFYKHGDKKHDRWGACSFSQRQGYVDITLTNGSSYNLSPRDDANQFKDQEGNKVDRTQASGNRQVYEWHNDRQKLVVNFHEGATSDKSSAGESTSASGNVAVKDMPRYCAGEASAKFNQKPNRITTQNAVEDQGMYSVWGQYEMDPNPQVFICTFSSDGKLVGVDKYTP